MAVVQICYYEGPVKFKEKALLGETVMQLFEAVEVEAGIQRLDV